MKEGWGPLRERQPYALSQDCTQEELGTEKRLGMWDSWMRKKMEWNGKGRLVAIHPNSYEGKIKFYFILGTFRSLGKVSSRRVKWAGSYFKKVVWYMASTLKGARGSRSIVRVSFNQPRKSGGTRFGEVEGRKIELERKAWWRHQPRDVENGGERRQSEESGDGAVTWFPDTWESGEVVCVQEKLRVQYLTD